MGRGFGNPPLRWSELERRLSGRGAETSRTPRDETPEPAAPHTAGSSQRSGGPRSKHTDDEVAYAELHAHSHYSFLDGANSPQQLLEEAARKQLSGLALTDHNGLYGAAEFADSAAQLATPIDTVYGAELTLELGHSPPEAADPGGTHLQVLAEGQAGYHQLAAAITEAQLRGKTKGRPDFQLEELAGFGRDNWVILTGCRKGALQRALCTDAPRSERQASAAAELDKLVSLFGHDRVYVELTNHGHPGDDIRCVELAELASRARLPTIATGGVHAATAFDTQLAEAASAIRARRSLTELDPHLGASGAAYLRSGRAMMRLHHRTPDAVTRSARLARQLAFSLQSAKPQLPDLTVPHGYTPMQRLRELVWNGVRKRYPDADAHVYERIERELQVIEQKDFPGYFLIVHDIVQEARRRGILCQGRGSAANSAVCYTLEITAVDSIRFRLPFERFLSSLREEEPDIDVDFDAARREEIIQYVYDRYGRKNAAQVANVITYRPKAAVRDAAKALGYSSGQQRAFTRGLERGSHLEHEPNIPQPVLSLAQRLLTSPRHLGIHSGGMVITRQPVGEVCPIEHARMPGRTVLQWDKESCASMGLVKFDLLSLGMLNALQQCFDLIAQTTGEVWNLDSIPKEEPGVYDMLCRADAVGLFQVESRAQLNTLPRLLPRRFEDLVIEIALIRPGPVQGGAVHPYLRRRAGLEPVTFAHPSLEPVLGRTLGIPLFQEQLMQIAMTIGDCSAEDADLLRRAMGSKRGVERIDRLKQQLFTGMARHGITGEAADRIYAQIEAFAGFGFAESHSISFALIVYASAWIKLHYPAAYVASLLRAQPMGFYAPRSLVADARRHGVTVHKPDVFWSFTDTALEMLHPPADATAAEHTAVCTHPGSIAATGLHECLNQKQPEPGPFDAGTSRGNGGDSGAQHRRDTKLAVRLGLSTIRGLETNSAKRIVAARQERPFSSLEDLARRADLNQTALEALANAGALGGFDLTRREALWQAAPAATHREQFLAHTASSVQMPLLPVLTEAERVSLDLWSTGVHSNTHPFELIREQLDTRHVVRSDLLRAQEPDTLVSVAGIVTHRQRPATASGITFITLEDERGSVNIIVWRRVWERHRALIRTAPALLVRGRVERSAEGLCHVIAQNFADLPAPKAVRSRDFH
jgi:error-prone DNA polymerase